jgi:hypothetical protein
VATARLDAASRGHFVEPRELTAHGTQIGVEVVLPLPEGPSGSWVADIAPLNSSTCLSEAALPRAQVVEGTPVGLPPDLQPIVDPY